MLIRLLRRLIGNRKKNNKENKYGFSRIEAEKRLERLNLDIDDASIIQEKLELDRENHRKKIEKLKSEGKSATTLAPLVVKYKNLGRLTNLNSEKLVKLYEIQGALNLMILSETSFTVEEVDKISDLFAQADAQLNMFMAATDDLSEAIDTSEMGSTDDKVDYLDEFEEIISREEKAKNKKINLDEM